jgi:hypothetical protein
MPKVRKSIIGMGAACILLVLQLATAGSAAAVTSSDVQQYKTCSDIGIGVSASVSAGTTYLYNEIAYHGTDCGDQAQATYVYAIIWACDSSGANCIGVTSPDYSNDVGSYDFFDSRHTAEVSGYYYKFCVSLNNNDLERYNLCTGLVHP